MFVFLTHLYSSFFCLEIVGVSHTTARQTSLFWPGVFNGNMFLLSGLKLSNNNFLI